MSAAFHNESAAVRAKYDEISSFRELAARRAFYRDLSPSMKDDVWLLHLYEFLHTEQSITYEQRSVVLDAIGLMASGSLAQTTDGANAEYAFNRLKEIKSRVREVMPPDLIHRAFMYLGRAPNAFGGGNLRIESLWIPTNDCTCSSENNWCNQVTDPSPYCNQRERKCRSTADGCGLLWRYSCDGDCSSTPNP